MKREIGSAVGSLGLLVAVSLGLWSQFSDLPNFAPVAGLAMFAGFLFPVRWAIWAPLSFLLIKDAWMGGYQPLLMVSVYAMLVLPIFLGRGWRAWTARTARENADSVSRGVAAVVALVSATLASSLAFFLVTNFATWCVTPWYERSVAGLVSCYANALPFFRFTLAGDLCSMGLFFGVYLAVRRWSEHAAAGKVVGALRAR